MLNDIVQRGKVEATMDVFATYDAVRDHAFVCFQKATGDPDEAGYLDDGLYVEFSIQDQAMLRVVSVEHPFFARSPQFADRLQDLLGTTITSRLQQCHKRAAALVADIPVDEAEIAMRQPIWHAAVAKIRTDQAQPSRGRLSTQTAPMRKSVSIVTKRAGKAIREWRFPVTLDPVVARAAEVECDIESAPASFSGIFELPSELIETLHVEPAGRIDIAGDTLHLRILVRGGWTPPRLMVETSSAVAAAEAALGDGELKTQISLSEPPTTDAHGRVTQELRFWLTDYPEADGG
jgi:hypothetical protein